LKLLVVRVGIHAQLKGVFALGFGKANQVFYPAILRIAALGTRDRVARSPENSA
jgi:hypothetical protein